MRRTLLNLLLRSLVKPVWRRSPSIETLRRHAATLDRHFGAAPGGEALRIEALAHGREALWTGARERAAAGVVLFLHGGAFCVHLPGIYRGFCTDLSRRIGAPVLMPDYRLAPEHPAPAALDDCQAAYAKLLDEVPARRIVLAGDSAGGNLTLALLQRCKRLGLPLPAGAVLLSPLTDFSGDSCSLEFNEKRDVMFTRHALNAVVTHYLPDMLADDPEVSPLLGDWNGLPPLRFHVSSSEMLLDDSLRAVERARMCGVDARVTVWDRLPHVFALFDGLPQAGACRSAVADFVRQCLAPPVDPAPAVPIDEKRIAEPAALLEH